MEQSGLESSGLKPRFCNVLADLRVEDHVLDLERFDADHLAVVDRRAPSNRLLTRPLNMRRFV